jgi:hypothetical protein
MKKIVVFFIFSTSRGIFIPQSDQVTVTYSGILEKELNNIQAEAKKLLKEKIGVHADNALVTGMMPISSVY